MGYKARHPTANFFDYFVVFFLRIHKKTRLPYSSSSAGRFSAHKPSNPYQRKRRAEWNLTDFLPFFFSFSFELLLRHSASTSTHRL